VPLCREPSESMSACDRGGGSPPLPGPAPAAGDLMPDDARGDWAAVDGVGSTTKTQVGHSVQLVYQELRTLILSCKLRPGEITSQVALSEMLPTSRTPLREALRLLQHEGLVVLEPNRRVRIADVSMDEFEGLQVMRIVLEAVALRFTIPQLVSEDFAEFEGLMAQMEMYMAEGDHERFEVPHRAFHLRLTRGVTTVQRAYISALFDHTTRYRRHSFDVLGAVDYTVRRKEHRAMVDAARAGDVDGAVAELAHHYGRTLTDLSKSAEMPSQVRMAVRTASAADPGIDAHDDPRAVDAVPAVE
jgi:DNA-binding GntR family transcriptional regulator